MNKKNADRYDPNSGGQEAMKRIMEAYGFKTRTELSDYTGISNSTLNTWWRRDFYPAQVMVWCSLETGASLQWLATGEGQMFEDTDSQIQKINLFSLDKGILRDTGAVLFDKSLLQSQSDLIAVNSGDSTYIVNKSFQTVLDGKWLVEIEGMKSIRDLELVPVGRVRISGGEIKPPFECALADIKIIGIVERVISKA